MLNWLKIVFVLLLVVRLSPSEAHAVSRHATISAYVDGHKQDEVTRQQRVSDRLLEEQSDLQFDGRFRWPVHDLLAITTAGTAVATLQLSSAFYLPTDNPPQQFYRALLFPFHTYR